MVTTGLVNPLPDLIYKSLDAVPAITSTGPVGTRTAVRSINSTGFIGYSAAVGNG